MRRTFMTLGVALLLAGVAAALPTMAGDAGTIYIDYLTEASGQVIKYIDVDGGWNATTALATLQTVPDASYPTYGNSGTLNANYGYGLTSALSADNGGVAHGGALLIEALNGGDAARDLLSVTGAGVTSISGGDASTTYISGRWGMGNVVVDAGFTGSGQGIVTANYRSASPSTVLRTGVNYGTATTITSLNRNDEGGNLAYSPCNYTLTSGPNAGVTVTGVVGEVEIYYKKMELLYRTSTGTYIQMECPDPTYTFGKHANNWTNSHVLAIGDTDGDGHPDFYYLADVTVGQSQENEIIRGRDLDGDGLISSLTETTETGIFVEYNGDLGSTFTLVKGADGSWAMLVNQAIGAGNQHQLEIYPLTDGTLGGPKQVIATGLGAWNGDEFRTGMAFLPLGSAQQAPEPATLMLVGTGVLGLAGIMRRRLIH